MNLKSINRSKDMHPKMLVMLCLLCSQAFNTAIAVPAGNNIAKGKAATHSSSYSSRYPAGSATDGVTDSGFTHTNQEAGAWWQVDLGGVYDISNIKIFNRSDCCSERLNNFSILVSDAPLTANSGGTVFTENQLTFTGSKEFTGNAKGRYVRIFLKDIAYLSLAEVEVFGTASSVQIAAPADTQTAEIDVNGKNVTIVDYGSDTSSIVGRFKQNSDGTWTDTNSAAKTETVYQETGRDEWTVYLSNGASLNLWKKEVVKGGKKIHSIVASYVVKNAVTTVAVPTTPPAKTPANPAAVTSATGPNYYNEISKKLPSWSDFSRNKRDTTAISTGAAKSLPNETEDLEDGSSIEYSCNTEPYSITQTPQKLVTLDPDSNILYLGSILQGKGYIEGIGSFAELPIRQRAPVQVSIDILSGDNQVTVANPNVQSIDSAIGKLIQKAQSSGIKTGGAIAYDKVTSSSLDEAAVGLGLSVKYMGFSAKNKFNFSRSASKKTVLVNFTQKMFTARMVQPQLPGDLFSDQLTPKMLDEQIDRGRVSADNLPVYVDSITYGRVMTFSFTSSASEQDISNALQASYSAAGNSVGGTLDVKTRKVLQEAEIGLVAIGGDEKNALAAIRSGNIASYFDAGTALTSAEPISYTIRNVGDNSLAKVSDTLSYNVKTCQSQLKEAPVVAVEVQVNLDRVVVHNTCDNGSGADLYGNLYIGSTNHNVGKKSIGKGGTRAIDFTTGPVLLKVGETLKFGGKLLDKDNNKPDRIGDWSLSFEAFDAAGKLKPNGSYGSKSAYSKPQCDSTLHYTITKKAELKKGNARLR